MLEFSQASSLDATELDMLDREIFGNKNYSNYREILRSDVASVFVAKYGESIAGYIYLSCAGDEGEIYHIGVREKFRRRNIAIKLIQFSFEKLKTKGIKKIFLEVKSENIAAIRLYEKVGFMQYNLRRNYYGNGIDAKCYVMEVV